MLRTDGPTYQYSRKKSGNLGTPFTPFFRQKNTPKVNFVEKCEKSQKIKISFPYPNPDTLVDSTTKLRKYNSRDFDDKSA